MYFNEDEGFMCCMVSTVWSQWRVFGMGMIGF